MKYLTFKSSPPRAPAAGDGLATRPDPSRVPGNRYGVDPSPAVASDGEIEEWLRDAAGSETAGVLIANLIAKVVELGLPSRMARSLESRLTTAIALLARPDPSASNLAVEQLQSFIRRVEIMSGAMISEPDAVALVDRAIQIIHRI